MFLAVFDRKFGLFLFSFCLLLTLIPFLGRTAPGKTGGRVYPPIRLFVPYIVEYALFEYIYVYV